MSIAVSFVKKHKYPLILIAFLLAVFVIPEFFMQLPRGHDIYYHMYRLESLSVELKEGNIPARIYSNMFGGYGYASPMFYGDWLMLPCALLMVMGVSCVTAYTVFLMMCAFLTAFSMYFSSLYMFGSKRAAFVSAFSYVFSVYFFVDMFWRHAVGEMQAFIFLPIVIAGLYSLLFKDGRYWYLLGLGLCGVLISHVLTAAVTVLFLILFCLVYIKKFISQPKKILYVALAALVFFLASASFIFPMLEQMTSAKFLGTDGTSATKYGTLLQRSMPTLASLFNPMNNQLEYEHYIPDGMGILFVIPLLFRIFFRKEYKNKPTVVFLALAALALFATSSAFPWDALQETCGILQFPWRLMVFATLFTALFAGSCVPETDGGGKWYSGTVMLFVCVALTLTAAPKYGRYLEYAKNGSIVTYEYEYNIGAGEYLPSGTKSSLLIASAKAGDSYSVGSKIGHVSLSRKSGALTVMFSGNSAESNYIELPLVNYLGYKAYLLREDGSSEELATEYGNNNLLRVGIPECDAGIITVSYDGTAVQKLSFCVTVLTFSAFIGYWLFLLIQIKCKRNTRPQEAKE